MGEGQTVGEGTNGMTQGWLSFVVVAAAIAVGCRSELYSPRHWKKSHKLLETGRRRQGRTLVVMLQMAPAGRKADADGGSVSGGRGRGEKRRLRSELSGRGWAVSQQLTSSARLLVRT